MEQALADAAAYATGRCFVCTHQMAALFCAEWHHGRRLKIMTSYQKSDSINQRSTNYNPGNFDDKPIWNDGAL